MSKKTIIFIILAIVLGIGIGTATTIGIQKVFLIDLGGEAGATETKKAVEEGPVVEVGEFTVNLQGGAFLKTTIAVEGINDKSEEALTSNNSTALMKDRINTVLSSKSLKDMQPSVRDELREELVLELNEVTGNNIQNVLFLTFVYQ